MKRKKLFASLLSFALCAAMSVTAHADNNLQRAMENISNRALSAAIQQGSVPPDTSIYDCAYGKGANGETAVVRYKNKDSVWIDTATQAPAEHQTLDNISTAPPPTAEQLAEYADEVFRLTNEARVEAGLPTLERSDTLEEAAEIRAGECASVNSLFIDGRPHIRPDGSKWFTVFGIDENTCYGENAGQGKDTGAKQVASWMKSDGHRANILHDEYTEIGIGVAVSERGSHFAIQIFSRP